MEPDKNKNPGPKGKLKTEINTYTTWAGIEEAQRIKAGISHPDLMEIEPLHTDEFRDPWDKRRLK